MKITDKFGIKSMNLALFSMLTTCRKTLAQTIDDWGDYCGPKSIGKFDEIEHAIQPLSINYLAHGMAPV